MTVETDLSAAPVNGIRSPLLGTNTFGTKPIESLSRRDDPTRQAITPGTKRIKTNSGQHKKTPNQLDEPCRQGCRNRRMRTASKVGPVL
jgi:hypothetical protein